MMEAYRGFFAASAGAAAGFIGLLFVALSFIESEGTSEKMKNWRRIMANSAFSQLLNIFFVSLAGMLPGERPFAIAGCMMALAGLAVSFRLLPQTTNRDRTGRAAPTVLGLAAVGVYALQLFAAGWLLRNPDSHGAVGCIILAIFFLYAGALARAWEITGVKKR